MTTDTSSATVCIRTAQIHLGSAPHHAIQRPQDGRGDLLLQEGFGQQLAHHPIHGGVQILLRMRSIKQARAVCPDRLVARLVLHKQLNADTQPGIRALCRCDKTATTCHEISTPDC